MKSIACALILALFLLSLTAPQLTTAQTRGSSASGSYKFILEDGLIKYVEFNAVTDEKGTTTGLMTFTDEAQISNQYDVEDPQKWDAPPEFYIKAEFDGLTVEKNRALMSGIVRDSSHATYVGKWVQLVVEDNGDDLKSPDKLTWRLCSPTAGGWIPTDAERKSDDGAFLRWWATDAERKDDVGVPSKNLISGDMKGCEKFPLSTYSFVDLTKWEGNIQVTP